MLKHAAVAQHTRAHARTHTHIVLQCNSYQATSLHIHLIGEKTEAQRKKRNKSLSHGQEKTQKELEGQLEIYSAVNLDEFLFLR